MKDKKTPKNKTDKKPPVEGGVPPSEPIKPNPVNDEKLSFAYTELIFDDYFLSQGRRFVRFFLDREEPCYISMTYGEFIEYQLAVWEAKNKLSENAKEGEEICVCDIANPKHYERMEDMEITIPIQNPNTKEIEDVIIRTPVYFINFLAEEITVGGLCTFDNKTKKK